MNPIKPMLCHELEVNNILSNGIDDTKVTKAYRAAIIEALKGLMQRGYVAERKGNVASCHVL